MFLFCLCRLVLPDKVPDKAQSTNSHQLLLLGDKWKLREENNIHSAQTDKLLCLCMFVTGVVVALSPHESVSCCSVCQRSATRRDETIEVVVGKKNHASGILNPHP